MCNILLFFYYTINYLIFIYNFYEYFLQCYAVILTLALKIQINLSYEFKYIRSINTQFVKNMNEKHKKPEFRIWYWQQIFKMMSFKEYFSSNYLSEKWLWKIFYSRVLIIVSFSSSSWALSQTLNKYFKHISHKLMCIF